ncbi:cadherin-related family member 5-like [Lethenteron reissneri]|uniref:cadherin-related family member 5-like n=1 Tax=Lethenteron reissneri TaxID=7753 RepID=UPI002AB6EEBC|nr:cadherin-related family member 5-like [Lethenteron reissneri]
MKKAVPSKTETPEINLQIVAYQDDFQKFTITTATIKVVTRNESHPAFSEAEYCGHVPNNADVIFATMCNSPNILQLQVNDADYATGHPIVEYTIVGEGKEHIEIHPNGYVLVRSSNLVAGQEYTFDIEAKDIENGDISQTRLTINVQAETTTAPTTTTPPTTETSATIPTTTRPESVSPGGGVTPTSNPADISTGSGISKATTTLSTNAQQSTASTLSRPTGGTTAKTTPHGAISSTTARPGGTGTTVNVPEGSTPQTTQGSDGPTVTGPQITTGGSDRPTVPGPQPTAGGSDRPTATRPHSTAGGSDRPTVPVPQPTAGGSDRPTVTGPHPTDGGSNRPTVPDPRPTAGGSDSPTLPDPRPTSGGPEKIYTAKDMAIVGGVLGALLAVALGVIGFLLFKVLSKKKKPVKIEDDAHYGGGGGDDGGYANSRKGSGQQDDISIGDIGRDDDLNIVNHYIHLPKDHMQDTDVDRSSGYNSVSGRPTTPMLEDMEEHSAPPPQPRDNPAFEADAAVAAAAAAATVAAADDEQATHTKSILVTMNSNEKVANDKAGYKAVWFKDEVIPDGGEAADEADGRAAGGVRFDGEPADDAEGKESSGAAVAGSGLDSSAMHMGGAVAEDDEFASL